ncbi:HNH endonuclease signature motif containing protein [Mycolicibacterium fortuitum]|uniref:HNH endonuclease signature motif containing protein n=1 Tax=Mycolicibacterium fortuitum TaxID=1766 RepID=UPI0009C0D1B7|nr:HNH endonuclease signature motif containing protein [Mycolicibacterium fortuitum]
MYVRVMQAGVVDAVAELRAAFDAFAACDFGSLTRAELISVLDEYEALLCRLPAVGHRLLARLQVEATPGELGAKSWSEVLRTRWRLSTAEAGRRLGEAAELGPRRALSGEPLAPVLPAVAAAQAAGLLNGEHVKVLRDAVHRLPGFVDAATAEQFEADLVRVAVGVGPKELKDTAELRLFLLDQDGPEPDDTERARKRGLSTGTQGRDAMTPWTANLTPEAAAVWEVLFAKFAAPGMCNPDDPEPCTSGTPTQAQIDNDHRSLAQRQHDALLVVGRIALMTDLGQLNGLPVSLIIRTTVQDLQSRAGVGISGGGTKIPIKDVLRMAAHAHHFLAVFDQASGSALNLFRARRIASPAQRIMLIARDGGCTKPGCTVGAYGCQAHHATADWAAGGNTNVDDMALACGPDNRLVDADGGYSTTLTSDGVVQWHPPPALDHGQHRINYLHRPELLLTPPEPAPAPADLTPDPTWEWEREPGPHQRSQPDPNLTPDPDPDLRPQPELDPDPDWDIRPHLEHEPDTEWDVDWNTNWDSTFCEPDLPSVEHLWDPEPYALEAIEPEIPAGWTLLDTPDPWQPISNSNAVSGKAVRGP